MLPNHLEAKLREILASPSDGRGRAIEALCEQHPTHRQALMERLQEWPTLAAQDAEPVPQHDDRNEAQPNAGKDDGRPRQIDRYRIIRPLGEGGMGTVYLAEQKQPIMRRVALKLIKLGMDSRAVVARFEHERQALAMMSHTGIAKVFDCGTSERGQPYFVMELAQGQPLTDYCEQQQMPLRDRLRLIQQVCDAVQHAHQKSIVHRDLKPSNVLVTDGEGEAKVKVIDFGLAKALTGKLTDSTLHTEAGQILGTPGYMAPEQADPTSQDIDTRTDIYSLGVMLYELLVDDLPYSLEEQRRGLVLGKHPALSAIEPPRPSTRLATNASQRDRVATSRKLSAPALKRVLKGDLDWIVLKALATEPERRYASASALSQDIQRFLDSEPVLAGPTSTTYRLKRFVRRYRLQVTAAALILITLVGGAIGTFVQYLRAEQKAVEAQANLTKVTRLLDFAAAHVLRDREATLYPPTAEQVPVLEGWLERADRHLVQLTEHQRRAAVSADDTSFAALELRRGVADLERLQQLRPQVLARLARARTLFAETIEAQAILWAETRSAIAKSWHYEDLDVPPQLGLIPLGPNKQGYHEFWHVLSGERPERDEHGRLVMKPESGMVLVLTPGTPPDASEGKAIAPFFLSKYETTQAQWQRAMGANASLMQPPSASYWVASKQWSQTPISVTHPVESVSWTDCTACARRWDLRLPSSDEWQHAAIADSDSTFVWGDDHASLHGKENLLDLSHTPKAAAQGGMAYDDGYPLHAPVGSFAANPFGLFDMLGNVSEWCADEQGDAEVAELVRGQRVIRGGSWYQQMLWANPRRYQWAEPASRNQIRGVRFAASIR